MKKYFFAVVASAILFCSNVSFADDSKPEDGVPSDTPPVVPVVPSAFTNMELEKFRLVLEQVLQPDRDRLSALEQTTADLNLKVEGLSGSVESLTTKFAAMEAASKVQFEGMRNEIKGLDDKIPLLVENGMQNKAKKAIQAVTGQTVVSTSATSVPAAMANTKTAITELKAGTLVFKDHSGTNYPFVYQNGSMINTQTGQNLPGGLSGSIIRIAADGSETPFTYSSQPTAVNPTCTSSTCRG